MMEKEKNKVEFEQIIERGCGIDIHKKVLVATIRGTGIKEETRSFDGFTSSIEEMRDWLKENGREVKRRIRTCTFSIFS